ncbi:MAG: hypothetical protein VXW31_01360 [Planctomycetota bacterium]|nr:hypothetical protein [Planctomycetota bacterium]
MVRVRVRVRVTAAEEPRKPHTVVTSCRTTASPMLDAMMKEEESTRCHVLSVSTWVRVRVRVWVS